MESHQVFGGWTMYSEKELNSLNDYELIYLIGMNDPEALMLLRLKYRPAEGYLYKKYFTRYRDRYLRDDWFAECDSELVKAVRRFHDTDECSFRTYIELVFKRKALNVLRTLERKYQDLHIEDISAQNSDEKDQASDYLDLLKD